MKEPLRFVEITDINDDLLLPWLDLYEISFPPEEKVFVSYFLALLKDKAKGLRADSYMTAAVDGDGALVGLMRFDANIEQTAYLWYLAVHPDMQGQGVGSFCHDEVLQRSREAGARAAVMEVEIPEEISDPQHRKRAEMRIEFYKRHGALLLRGIRYIHSVGPHQPEIPLHIMICPFESITPQEAFGMAKWLFGESLTQVGELRLV